MKTIYNFWIEDAELLEEIGLTPEETSKIEYLSYSTVFVDIDGKKLLGSFSENDGEWRDEYFNPIFKNLGIEIKSIDISEFSNEQTIVLKEILTKDDNDA